jgi:Rv2525c-like, glycoside hydrolase-like domain
MAKAAAAIAQAAGAVTGQPAPLARNVEKGKHLGFDTNVYPGDATMRIWKETPGANYKWVGFYLPAPCHTDTSWTGKRDTLKAMGWGVAVIYVGQQTWGKRPASLSDAQRAALRRHDPCAANLVSASEGVRDADDAIRRAEAEGFPPRTSIFLDLERMETIPAPMRDYYRAWTQRLLQHGGYRPAVYVHRHNAPVVYRDFAAMYRLAGVREAPRFWIAGGSGFEKARAPQDVGFAFAGVWQGVLDVARSVGEVKLPVDLNIASWASPSEAKIDVR